MSTHKDDKAPYASVRNMWDGNIELDGLVENIGMEISKHFVNTERQMTDGMESHAWFLSQFLKNGSGCET